MPHFKKVFVYCSVACSNCVLFTYQHTPAISSEITFSLKEVFFFFFLDEIMKRSSVMQSH